jgi:hypothetical protein
MNYRSADGQTHAQTLGLGGIEHLEEPLKSLRVQSRPRLLHDRPPCGRLRVVSEIKMNGTSGERSWAMFKADSPSRQAMG